MDTDSRVYYQANTIQQKIVSDYTGLNFFQLLTLDYFDFLSLLRDAIIYSHNQSIAGREYLEKCWYLEQTEPDRNTLRRKFGGGK